MSYSSGKLISQNTLGRGCQSARSGTLTYRDTVPGVPQGPQGPQGRCVGRVYGAALKTTTHPQTLCTKPYAATQHLILLMMTVCTRNM